MNVLNEVIIFSSQQLRAILSFKIKISCFKMCFMN